MADCSQPVSELKLADLNLVGRLTIMCVERCGHV